MYLKYFVVFGVVFYLAIVRSQAKNYVQWDDDEHSDLAKEIVRKQEGKDSWWDSSHSSKIARKSTGAHRSNRLIYHGRIKQNGTLKVIDGIKLSINTHQPLPVNRDRYSLLETANSSRLANQPKSSSDELSGWRRLPTVSPTNKTRDPSEHSLLGQSELVSSSDWRPITLVATRSRRASRTQSNLSELSSNSSSKAKPSPFKWKPIKTKPSGELGRLLQEEVTSQASKIVQTTEPRRAGYGLPSLNDKTGGVRQASFEEPFDDDGLVGIMSEDRQTSSSLRSRESKSLLVNQRWTPVDTTTPLAVAMTSGLTSPSASKYVKSGPNLVTTTPPPATTTSSTNGSSALEPAAQRSASDLNYIYSSQPDRQSGGGGSYYSNYVIPQQPQQPDLLQPINQPIVDNVSGQTPEIISERVPEERLPEPPLISVPNADYSVPQTVSAFQPALPPPSRSNYGAYESQGYYSQQRTSRQLPVSTSAPQFVRQEHHYHYYNPNQAERLQSQPAQPVSPQPSPPVAREIQPIFISQPMMMQQQAPSSTQAPQIIREIIKEVPAIAPVQLQRIVLPQPPVIPPPVPLPTRELVPEYTSLADQAQRVVRTISGQVPSIAAIRVPQIRLTLPTIQMGSLRLATGQSSAMPITRQTGSFIIPPLPQKTTTYLTETQAMPTHTTIMHTTQFTPATRTTVYTTDHQPQPTRLSSAGYRRRR